MLICCNCSRNHLKFLTSSHTWRSGNNISCSLCITTSRQLPFPFAQLWLQGWKSFIFIPLLVVPVTTGNHITTTTGSDEEKEQRNMICDYDIGWLESPKTTNIWPFAVPDLCRWDKMWSHPNPTGPSKWQRGKAGLRAWASGERKRTKFRWNITAAQVLSPSEQLLKGLITIPFYHHNDCVSEYFPRPAQARSTWYSVG